MLGDNIKKIASNKNMSIYQVTQKSKVSTGYMYDIVNNKCTNPSIDIIKKIARALEVPITQLLELEDTTQKEAI